MSQTRTMLSSAWTTGAGIAIGTNIDIGGVLMGPAASTVTVKQGSTTILSISGGNVSLAIPIAVQSGPVDATSSGGSFSVIYRQRPR